MTIEFKKHKITRNCEKKYKDYHCYKKYLKDDFQRRCAYCNTHDEWLLPLPFEIDHFIPRAVFEEAKRTDLDTDYRNLMYSCPICNRLKSNLYKGNIPEKEIVNPFFYNPVDIDYNTIFFRDEKGRICSDDKMGKQMIKRLQFYRPTKQLAWFLDELYGVCQEIRARLKNEVDPEKRLQLEIAQEKLEAALFRRHRYFVHSYMTEKGRKYAIAKGERG